jgi:hypothetical protein
MKESTLSKISASVAVAKGMAQRALPASPNPQWAAGHALHQNFDVNKLWTRERAAH